MKKTKTLNGPLAGTLVALLLLTVGAAGQEPPAWQTLLQRIVDINSGSGNTAGLEAVRQVLMPELEALGLDATSHDLGDGHRLLSASVPGEEPDLLLMGHIDTVFEPDSPFQTFKSDGDDLRGPGIIDMKAGVVLMLDVLKALSPAERARVLVLLNDDEEVGSPYSRPLVLDVTRDIRAGLVFEPGLPDGAVVTSHSGVVWLTLVVEGRAAHAGLEPEKGINACVELAHKLVRVAALGDKARKLSVNVGTVDGGTKPNVVCERAVSRIDIRYVEPDDRERTLAALRTITNGMTVDNPLLGIGPTADLSVDIVVPSMPPASTDRLFGLLQTAGAAVGQEVRGSHVGYASDANGLTETGMDLLVGVGPYGGGMHTENEFLSVATYGERLALVNALMAEILK